MSSHWVRGYDPGDGEPYGNICRCGIGVDHNEYGEPDEWDDDDD